MHEVRKAIYPGSFDPVTLGHLDIITRASEVVDELTVAVLNNSSKSPLFSVDERVKMLEEVTKHLPNVKIGTYNKLLVDYAEEIGATIIVRGLRAITDFEYELQMAQTNRIMNSKIDTIFFTTNIVYSYLSSSTVKEIARYGGDISNFLAPYVEEKVHEKIKEINKLA